MRLPDLAGPRAMAYPADREVGWDERSFPAEASTGMGSPLDATEPGCKPAPRSTSSTICPDLSCSEQAHTGGTHCVAFALNAMVCGPTSERASNKVNALHIFTIFVKTDDKLSWVSAVKAASVKQI